MAIVTAPTGSGDFSCLHVNYFRTIVAESSRNTNFVDTNDFNKETKDRFIQILQKGIWYPRHYMKILQKCRQNDRIKYLEANNEHYLEYGFLSTKHFSLDNTKKYAFQIKDCKPSQALASIGEQLALLDCGAVYCLAFFRALQDFIGTEKFDYLFAYDGNMPFVFVSDLGSSIFLRLFTIEKIRSSADLREGDKCYFSNICLYKLKHSVGSAGGFNVIYTNNTNPFLGFGLPPEGISIEGVEKALFDAYNENSTRGDPTLATHTVSWEEFQSMEGSSIAQKERKLSLMVLRPDISKIQSLAQASLANIRDIFLRLRSE